MTAYRTEAQPPTYQRTPEERNRAAFDAVYATLAELGDANAQRNVLLAASALFDLGLYDTAAHDGDHLALTISDAERLLRAARGEASK